MSRWDEIYQSHPIHSTIVQLKKFLDESGGDIKPDLIDAEHEVEKRRLTKILGKFEAVLAGLDPEIVPIDKINSINKHLRSPGFWNEIQLYPKMPNTNVLRLANDHLDQIISVIFELVAGSDSKTEVHALAGVEKVYDDFSAKIKIQENSISTALDEYEQTLGSLKIEELQLREQVEFLRDRNSQQLNEWLTTFTEDQARRLEEESELNRDKSNKFDSLIKQIKNQSDNDILNIREVHEEKLNNIRVEFEKEVEQVINSANEKHKSILEIHELVATDGVAGGYKKSALDEGKTANLWRWIAVGSFVSAAFWVFMKLTYFEADPYYEMNWGELITATSLTLILLSLAAYASTQSKLHRESELHMRWFALEVTAIDPFISSLPEPDQIALKKAFSERLFGKDRVAKDKSTSNISAKILDQISDQTIAKISNLRKVLDK